MPKRLLVGATGMVGTSLANISLAAQHNNPLTILARRQPIGRAWHAGVDGHIAPAEQWPTVIAAIAPAVLFNCLGTTIAQAGSQAAFRAVDHDLVLAVARAAKAAGARHVISVSSVGANTDSGNFYLATKGAVEAALRALAFDRLDIIRPGLLIGDRAGPLRRGERIGMALSPLTDALMVGCLRRYRSVRADMVARAMLALATAGGTGAHIHEHDAIVALAD